MSKKLLLLISFVLVLSLAYTSYGADTTPPAPSMKWYLSPTAMGPYAITMGVTISIDAETPPVWYYFECTNDAGKSSGWIRCTDTPTDFNEPNGPEPATYTATGLTPDTEYSFRVKCRDSVSPTPNERSFIATRSVKTDRVTTPPIIRLDINPATDNNDANTQVGFAGFQSSYTGNEANDINGNPSGVIIDLGGDFQATLRVDPCGRWLGAGTDLDPCLYMPRAGEWIYHDFISGIQPSGVEITLWGLGDGQDCNVTIWAYDSRSEGENRVAKWYANDAYIFDTNFVGGTTTWPNYEAVSGEDLYKHAYSAQVTADKFGRIALTSERNPASPSNQPFAFVNALKVEPNALTTFVPTKYAYHPVPFSGMEDVPVNTLLKWENGDGVSVHDLYLDTDFDDVNTGSPGCEIFEDDIAASSNEGYDPVGLKLDTTYYWRVDEDNTYIGEVWNFTTPPCAVAENFDSYATNSDLREVWKDSSTQDPPVTCAEVSVVEYAEVRSGKSMGYWFKNHSYEPYYSEVRADVNAAQPNGLGLDPNWLGMGAKSLVLWFYGDLDNDSCEPMYVKLTDGDDVNAIVAYDGDMDDITEPWWHEWNIDLQDFADGGVDLSDVETLTIGIGDGTQAANDGAVWIEDIRLCATRCVLSKRSPDFAEADYAALDTGNYPGGDCIVDYQELELMAYEWLYTWLQWGPVSPPPWPPSIPNLVAYWPMNEGDGNRIYTDPCDPDWTGTFSPSGVSWLMPGYVDSNAALRFNGELGTRVSCGNKNPADPAGQITLSAWVRWFGPRYWDPFLMSHSQGIIGKRSGYDESYMMFELELDTGGYTKSIAFRHFDAGDPCTPNLYAPNGLMNQFIGQWVHIAAAFPYPSGNPADANGHARIYLNGSQVADGPWRFSAGTDAYLTIGNTMDVNAWPLSPEALYGDLDDVCIYNRALTEEEIQYLASYVDPSMRPIYEAVNLYKDPCLFGTPCLQVINLKDYAVLMNHWLEEQLWP